MIEAKIFYKATKDVTHSYSDLRGFELKGHAGYAKTLFFFFKGDDIICAAISALSLNTANALTELTSNPVEVTQTDDGYVNVISNDKLDDYGQLLLEAFVLGIVNIQDNYGNEFIHIKFEEV
jgi:uncharacterized protein